MCLHCGKVAIRRLVPFCNWCHDAIGAKVSSCMSGVFNSYNSLNKWPSQQQSIEPINGHGRASGRAVSLDGPSPWQESVLLWSVHQLRPLICLITFLLIKYKIDCHWRGLLAPLCLPFSRLPLSLRGLYPHFPSPISLRACLPVRGPESVVQTGTC